MKNIKILQHCFFAAALLLLIFKKAELQKQQKEVAAAVKMNQGNKEEPKQENKTIKQTAAFLPNKDSKKQQ